MRKNVRVLIDHMITKVRDKIARIQAVEELEECGEANLQVNGLVFGEPWLILAVPGGEVEKYFEEIVEILRHRSWYDG